MISKQYSQSKARQRSWRHQDNPARQASYGPNGEYNHVAFRSCRLPLLSPSAPVAFRSCRLPLLSQVLWLFLLTVLLFSLPPAQAQGQMGNYWSVTPCDANGQAVANLTSDGNGYYGMTSGIESEQVSNTYPVAMVAAAVANPGTYGDYLQSAFPLGISPSLQTFSLPIYAPNPITVLGGNFGEGNAAAYNYVSRGSGAYTYSVPSFQGPPLTGPINGSLTKDLSGQLRFYWRVQWMGMGAPTVPMPDHINLCVKANLTATASVSYNSSVQRSGLSAQATASDQVGGSGFGDAVSASAGDTGTLPGSSLSSLHLVTASVSPLAGSTTTGIAEAYLNGSTHSFVNDTVPYLVPGTSPVMNGSTQAYTSVTVAGGVKQDNRIVWISSPEIDDSYHKGTYDSNLGTDRYLNKRNLDGSISTDTAAAYDQGWYGGFPFYGGNHYTANVPNFSNPVYNWNITATDNTGKDFTVPAGTTQTIQKIINLGPVTTGFPKHSTFIVSVQDGLDSAIATNTYGVTWHLPAENWHDLGARVEIPAKLFGTSDNSQPANGFVNVKVAPDEVDWSVASHVGGGIVTTFVAVLAVLQPETDPLIIGFLTASGYTLSLATPPDSTIYPLQGSEAQFIADVDTQNKITAGNTATVFMSGSPRFPADLARKIAASGNYHSYFTGALPPGFQFSVQVYRHRFTQNRLADGYGSHGYTGPVTGSLTVSGSLEYVYNWH